MSFDEKKVIVTGSTGYIGSCIVKEFLKKGAVVGCICRDINRYNSIFANFGNKIVPLCTDISDYEQMSEVISSFCDQYGEIDILVNCAGGSAREREKTFINQTKEVFNDVINVNLIGTIYASQLCLKYMNKGSIINISSYIGVLGQQYAAEYAAAKGGVIAFTKALAKEYAVRGVRVNCVSPGYVPRPEEIDQLGEEACSGFSYLEGRIKAQDIANTVLFLASDQSRYIIGQNIIVDGGSTLTLKNLKEGQEIINYKYVGIDCDKKYIIYATGNESQKYVDYLIQTGQYNSIVAFNDSDTSKWNKIYNGKKIISPIELIHLGDDINIIIASIYYEQIYKILQILGIDTIRILNYREKI